MLEGTSEFIATGDSVNLASRLEGLNKLYGTYILASEQVCAAAGSGFEWRRLDRVAVMGRSAGTLVSELLGEHGEVAPDMRELGTGDEHRRHPPAVVECAERRHRPIQQDCSSR